jgi:hypothetical protein
MNMVPKVIEIESTPVDQLVSKCNFKVLIKYNSVAFSPQVWLPLRNTDELQLYAMRIHKRYTQYCNEQNK